MPAYILTVDDDYSMLRMLSDVLAQEGYEVEQAVSGEQALVTLQERTPDLLVLDIQMPGMSGLALCRQLRADPRFITLPILFLTGLSQPSAVIEGLDAGGDDYIAKPIVIPIFQARVRALLRRGQAADDSTYEAVLTVGDLTLNSDTCQISVEDQDSVQLTATEHKLMRYLMEHPQQPLSAQHLLEAVWEYPERTGDPDLVRVHVRNLRAKIEPDTRNPTYIHTVHGIGYMIEGRARD
ncbi:MAG: response regulator transcription factor [Anaerolineae bacterium]|nr:response regulator transcription factor [Anaerolineae bacterium]